MYLNKVLKRKVYESICSICGEIVGTNDLTVYKTLVAGHRIMHNFDFVNSPRIIGIPSHIMRDRNETV